MAFYSGAGLQWIQDSELLEHEKGLSCSRLSGESSGKGVDRSLADQAFDHRVVSAVEVQRSVSPLVGGDFVHRLSVPLHADVEAEGWWLIE